MEVDSVELGVATALEDVGSRGDTDDERSLTGTGPAFDTDEEELLVELIGVAVVDPLTSSEADFSELSVGLVGLSDEEPPAEDLVTKSSLDELPDSETEPLWGAGVAAERLVDLLMVPEPDLLLDSAELLS